jgi:hypothetical protein
MLFPITEVYRQDGRYCPFVGLYPPFAASLLVIIARCRLTRRRIACRACLRPSPPFVGVAIRCVLRNRPYAVIGLGTLCSLWSQRAA